MRIRSNKCISVLRFVYIRNVYVDVDVSGDENKCVYFVFKFVFVLYFF